MLTTAIQTFRNLAAWFGGREPVVLLAGFILVATTWGFIEVASEVLDGDTHAFDKWVIEVTRSAEDPSLPIGPSWLRELGRDATALGGVGWLSFFTAVAAGYLLLDNKLRLMILLSLSSLGGLILTTSLKYLVSRPRPQADFYLSHVYTSSFPSGHSMLSAVIYLTAGVLLAASVSHVRLKIYVLSVAILLSLIVGASRVYLGVHYPTDVLAGWMAGAAWAILCWLVARWLRHRRLTFKPDT
ncbi:MAG TPA: phosphoesterase [Planctomycetaceae bacterium]|nr:phosphoesterase [Planctomycetaceae bacterium]